MVNKPNDAGAGAKQVAGDRRKYRRVELPLKAQFLTQSGEEQTCLVLNISPGGALLRTTRPPQFGERVVLYIAKIGRFEGAVIRSGKKSFAVAYDCKQTKTAKTADALTEIVNVGHRSKDSRTSPRIQQDAPALIRLEDGKTQQCSILDISLTGASIEIHPRPPLGTRIILGRMTAKVVRRHEKGVGVVFIGASEHMEEVIEETVADTPAPVSGAPIARKFGKKGASA